MILTLDIGNTHIVIGGFLDGELQFVSRLSTNAKKTEDEYAALLYDITRLEDVKKPEVRGAIISSVVPPLNATLTQAIEKVYGITPMIVGPGIKSGVNLLVDNPQQVGADLVCSAAAVAQRHPLPALVVDMGTATKISVIDETGAFRGVSIIPGVQIALSALSGGTAQLPQISLKAPKTIIGKNTVDSMQSGVVYGNACLIDGMAERMEAEFGAPLHKVATGGISKFIIPHCKTDFVLDEHLILKGLYMIYEKNK
ncbi:MAG: type III pantothenate kinase [Clostridia bacterium]|nr:type III pantothenate kinase [Clostridia bacterium]